MTLTVKITLLTSNSELSIEVEDAWHVRDRESAFVDKISDIAIKNRRVNRAIRARIFLRLTPHNYITCNDIS